MNLEQALRLLTILADGINPLTGEILPAEDSCNQVEIVRALNLVLRELTAQRHTQQAVKHPANAGKPWLKEDDELLRQMFDDGYTRKELREHFHVRTGRSLLV